jgi:hypothetical protein
LPAVHTRHACAGKLLLILPDRELFDYLCTGCGDSIGTREVTAADKLMNASLATRKSPGAAQVRIL